MVIMGKLKNFFHKLNTYRVRVIDWVEARRIRFTMVYSLCLALLIEVLCRHGIVETLQFLIRNPWAFALNALIIFFTLSLTLFLKKRCWLFVLISIVWLALGITNCIMTHMRVTPFSMDDLLIAKSVLPVIDMYLSVTAIIAIIVALVVLVALIVLLAIREKKRKPDYLRTGIAAGISGIGVVLAIVLFLNSVTVSKNYAFIGNGYKKYGFEISFVLSAIDRGMKEPEQYGPEEIEQIQNAIDDIETTQRPQKVNIVMLQLESFIDVNELKGVTFSENPLPYFTQLKQEYPSAYLTVPAFGAGTANTEFEVITQMNVKNFGIGETPYKSIMQDTACETVNYDLKELGYRCHAIHNHQGTFYSRNKVYANLGFDDFTSVEYMNNIERTPMGWARDAVLVDEIIDCLRSTEEQDFIYAISVQGHGKYPDGGVDYDRKIEVLDGFTAGDVESFTYYVNQIHEMDQFLASLTDALERFDEKTILVLYGDHFPGFDIEDDDLLSGDRFKTEYVIWSNFPLKTTAKDLTTYQLASSIMKLLGYNNGKLTKLHQNYASDENYAQLLYEMQYDMLYGDNYLTNGDNPYAPTDLKMGFRDIAVQKVVRVGQAVFLSGKGFTESSVVEVDGSGVDTVFINSSTLLILLDELPEEGCTLTVSQVCANDSVLSTTEPYVLSGLPVETSAPPHAVS